MATLKGIQRDPVKRPFRKAQIKRRQLADGLYEADWFDITKFVTKWGTLETTVDDLRLNQFTHAGVQLTVRNDFGEFNPEHEGGSLFFGFFTRYRTLLRIQAGYTDGAGNIFPDSDTTQGIFIMDGEININPKNNETRLNAKSIISPLQEFRAVEVDGITGVSTSSEIVAKIRDATDGSGNVLFRQFISASSWNIQTTTKTIDGLNTTTALEDFSVWDLMIKLAEAEGFIVHATRKGGINFGDREAATIASQLGLFGAGFRRPNVISINWSKEATNKLFTHIRFKHLEPDTSTSFVEAGTETVINIASLEWKYGRNTYTLENTFISDTATAQQAVSNLSQEFSNLRSEANLNAVFLPDIELLDRIDVSYREGSLTTVMLWDRKNWSSDTAADTDPKRLLWASETSSAIEWNQKNFKVLGRRTNLDNFTTNLILRETEK